jgi:hypothetical protein
MPPTVMVVLIPCDHFQKAAPNIHGMPAVRQLKLKPRKDVMCDLRENNKKMRIFYLLKTNSMIMCQMAQSKAQTPHEFEIYHF